MAPHPILSHHHCAAISPIPTTHRALQPSLLTCGAVGSGQGNAQPKKDGHERSPRHRHGVMLGVQPTLCGSQLPHHRHFLSHSNTHPDGAVPPFLLSSTAPSPTFCPMRALRFFLPLTPMGLPHWSRSPAQSPTRGGCPGGQTWGHSQGGLLGRLHGHMGSEQV